METFFVYLENTWHELEGVLVEPTNWLLMVGTAVLMSIILYALNDLTRRRTQVLTVSTICFMVGLNALATYNFGSLEPGSVELRYTVIIETIGLFFLIGLHIAHMFTQMKPDPIGIPLRFVASKFQRVADVLNKRADHASNHKSDKVIARLEKVILDENALNDALKR